MVAQVDLFRPALIRAHTASLERRSRRDRVLRALLLLGFLGLAAWSGVRCVFRPHSASVVSRQTTQPEAIPGETRLFKAAGHVEPRPTPASVSASGPGIVDRALVVKDQPLKGGEGLAELVKDHARHAYERALAELELREAELEEAEAVLTAAATRLAQPVHLEALLVETDAALANIETQLRNIPFEIRRAEARLDFAKREYERKSALQGVVADRAIDQARSALAEATASHEELQAQKDSLGKEREALVAHRDALKTQLELKTEETQARRKSEARLKAAQARLKRAGICLAEAKLRLDRTTVRAPVDGRVLGVVVQPGMFVDLTSLAPVRPEEESLPHESHPESGDLAGESQW